jgi:hypothetical protein
MSTGKMAEQGTGIHYSARHLFFIPHFAAHCCAVLGSRCAGFAQVLGSKTAQSLPKVLIINTDVRKKKLTGKVGSRET